MMLSISGQSTSVPASTEQEQTPISPKTIEFFPQPPSQQTQELIAAAEQVCEKIDSQKFRSGTAAGKQASNTFEINAGMIGQIRTLRSQHHLSGAGPASQASDFSYVYGSKTLSKIKCGQNTSLHFGNCGEKTCSAFLNLIKYHGQNIYSVEIITIKDQTSKLNHMFLILNRDNSEISLNPAQWKPMDPCDKVIVCDPSFNQVFLAEQYQGNMMLFVGASDVKGAHENIYVPYLHGQHEVTMSTRNRFEPKNETDNKFLKVYGSKDKDFQSDAEFDSRKAEIKQIRNAASPQLLEDLFEFMTMDD